MHLTITDMATEGSYVLMQINTTYAAAAAAAAAAALRKH